MNRLKTLEEIYVRYAPVMLAICMRYIGDRNLAQDVMHDGFIHIYQSLDKFEDRGKGSMRAWMEKVMVNHCLQYLRKKNVFRASEPITNLSEEESLQPEEWTEDMNHIPQEVLNRFIMELPDGYRTVFNMYVMEGMSHREIARTLSINERSSSSQLSRAKGLLIKKIKDYAAGKR